MRISRALATVAIAILLTTAAQAAPPQEPATSPGAAADIDARWLPWLGCWELVGDAVDYQEVESTGRRIVCLNARPDGRGVGLTTFVDGMVALERTVLADGVQHPREELGCTGWNSSSWSADGHRLFGSGELECAEAPRRSFQSLSLLAAGGVWVEIETVSIGGAGEHRELMIRRYRRAGIERTAELGYQPLSQGDAIAAATARAAASASLEPDDLIEAADRVPVEALEAAILESSSTFDVDADLLIAMADAGLPETVIDLMVAVSFPEDFVVDRGEIDETVEDYSYERDRYVRSYYYPPYSYGPYPAYYLYDPFFAPFGYGRFSYGYWPRSGRVSIRVPKTGSLFGGRVLQGRGYTRVQPRQNNSGSQGFFGRLVDSARGSSRSGSNGPSSVGGAGSGAGSATPKGFTRGGSSGTRKAKPRGGGGSKQKPRGG